MTRDFAIKSLYSSVDYDLEAFFNREVDLQSPLWNRHLRVYVKYISLFTRDIKNVFRNNVQNSGEKDNYIL